MEPSKNILKVDDSNSGFLSAAELVQIRKSNEEPARSNIGEKFYIRQYNWMECKAIECALENYTDSLKQNRAARKCDLMQAKWNVDLNVSITSKLKGKFLQHMGCAYEGKVALSPEESIFLLENGCLEVLNGEMPLSTEEAYKVMLKGDLSAEKYQVYSQLSQLGFIVVPHKGLSSKPEGSSKRQFKRKRSSSAEIFIEPERKRTSFLGALSNIPDTTVQPLKETNSVPETSFLGALSNIPDTTVHPLKEANSVPETTSEAVTDNLVSQESITIAMTPPSAEVPKSSTTRCDEAGSLEESNNISDPTVVTVDNSNISSLEINYDKEKLVPESVLSEVNSVEGLAALPSANSPIEEPRLSAEGSKEIHTSLSNKTVFDNEVSVHSDLCCSMNSSDVAIGLSEKDSKIANTTVNTKEISSEEIYVQREEPESCFGTNANQAPSNFQAAVNGSVVSYKEINNEEIKDFSGREEPCNDGSANIAPIVLGVAAPEVNIKEIDIGVNNEVFSPKKTAVQIEDPESCDANSNPIPSNFKADTSVSDEGSVEVNKVDENKTVCSSKEISVQIEDSNSCNETNSNPSNFEAAVRVSNNAIDIMNLDSGDTEISCSSEAFGKDVSDSVVSNEDWGVDHSGHYDRSNSDVMSCSSNDSDDVLSVGVGDEKLEDDEVQLLAVTKKEKEPLYCISLSTDSESSNDWNEDEDEDEIQVLKVCKGVHSKDKSRSSVIRSPVKCKKEEKPSGSNSCGITQVKFPHCARQAMVVVTRPPSMYLPPNVVLSKECYTLTFSPCRAQSQRVWNSYRELQTYKMAQQHNQRMEGFPSSQYGSNFHHNQYDSSGSYNLNSWSQDSSSHNRNSNRNSSPGFSCFPNSNPQNNRNRNDIPESNVSNRWSSGLNELSPNPTVNQFNMLSNRWPSGLNELSQNPSVNPYNMLPNFQYPSPSATAINSVVSVSNQDMNVSMVGNHILRPPQLLATVKRTAESIAREVFISMFGSNKKTNVVPPIPSFGAYPSPPQNGSHSFGLLPTPNLPFGGVPNYSVDPPLSNRRREQLRRNLSSNPFPCQYRNVTNRQSWNEVKEAVGEQDMELDVDNVKEVPLNLMDVLWDPAGICPLVKPGIKLPPAEVLKKLQVTKMANLRSNNPMNQVCLPTTCSLEISFDVYLPGTNYRKTSPGIPKHRIIVVRSTEPLPKYADLVFLQNKWNDGATLQLAVVDNGDISFQSFNNVCLSVLVPHEM